MKINKIIKSDLKNNWFIFLMATIALIVLMWIISEAPYYRWLQAYPELMNFLTVLAVILLILLAVSLSVYLLINNWYRDVHEKLIDQVRHKKLYHYYRVCYISLATIYFIVVALGTVIFFTDATWKELLREIWNLESIIILLNIYLLGLLLFYLVKYAILYSFKLKWTIIVPLTLMILSMLANLYIMINSGFSMAIWTTTLAFIFFWKLNAFELSSYKEVKKWPYFELAASLVTILIAVVAFNANMAQQPDQVADKPIQDGSESYEYEYVVEIVATEENEHGQVTIANEASMGYQINIVGEYNVFATQFKNEYSIVIDNPNTNEQVNLQVSGENSAEPYAFYDVTTIVSEKGESINYKQCSGSLFLQDVNSGDLATMLLEESCLSSEQISKLKPLVSYIMDTFAKYVN